MLMEKQRKLLYLTTNKKTVLLFTVIMEKDKKETFKYSVFENQKMLLCIFKRTKLLKLVVEKNVLNDEIMDFYCILDKKLKNKDNANFYEELKEYNKLISIV